MANEEQRVHDVALELNDAINEARAAGYKVTWPLASDGLQNISISAGAKALSDDESKAVGKERADRETRERAATDAQKAAALTPRLTDVPGNSL